jgi:hypothetical protein
MPGTALTSLRGTACLHHGEEADEESDADEQEPKPSME